MKIMVHLSQRQKLFNTDNYPGLQYTQTFDSSNSSLSSTAVLGGRVSVISGCGSVISGCGSLLSDSLRLLVGSRCADKVGSKSEGWGGLNSGNTGVCNLRLQGKKV